MLSTAWATPTLTVIRGWADTTAAIHADGATAYIAPWTTRKQVFDAVADAIVDLGSELWIKNTRLVTVSRTPYSLPSGTTEVYSWVLDNGEPGGDYRFHPDWPPAGSGKAIDFLDAPIGTTGYVTYLSKFPRPTAESDDLTATNDEWVIPVEWFKIIMVDALATLVVTRQADMMSTDWITEMLAQEGFDVSESRDIVRELLALRAAWIDRHVKRKRQTSGIKTVVQR